MKEQSTDRHFAHHTVRNVGNVVVFNDQQLDEKGLAYSIRSKCFRN